MIFVSSLATVWCGKGRFDVAEPIYRLAAHLSGDNPGENRLYKAYTFLRLGQLLAECRPRVDAEAERWLCRSCDFLGEARDRDHPDWAESLGALSEVRSRRGDHSLLPYVEQMLDVLTNKLGQDHYETVKQALCVGRVLLLAGRFGEAEHTVKQVCNVLASTLGLQHPLYWRALGVLGQVRLARGDPAEAQSLLAQAVQKLGEILNPSHPWLAEPMESMAESLERGGDVPAGRELRSRAQAIAIRPENPGDYAYHAKRLLNAGMYFESILLCYGAEQQATDSSRRDQLLDACETRAASCDAIGWLAEGAESYKQAEELCLEMADYTRLSRNLRHQAGIIFRQKGTGDELGRHLLAEADAFEARSRTERKQTDGGADP